MNGKTAKRLRKIGASTGANLATLKRVWHKTPHTLRDQLRAYMEARAATAPGTISKVPILRY